MTNPLCSCDGELRGLHVFIGSNHYILTRMEAWQLREELSRVISEYDVKQAHRNQVAKTQFDIMRDAGYNANQLIG